MPTDRFVVRLDAAPGQLATPRSPLSNLKRLTVTVNRANGSSRAQLPFAESAPPSAPDVWLQIWEVDRGSGGRTRALANARNDFLAEIPGAIVRTAAGSGRTPPTFEFRALGDARLAASSDARNLGSIALVLKDSSGGDWPATPPLRVPIRGEYEDIVDLGCVLLDATTRASAETTLASEDWTSDGVLHVPNLNRLIDEMLADGGLTVAFWARLNTEEDLRALDAYRRARQPIPDSTREQKAIVLTSYGSSRTLYNVINDREFHNAAVQFRRDFGSLGISDGELVAATTPFETTPRFEAIVQDTVRQVVAKVRSDHPGGGQALVRRLVVFTHGEDYGMRVSRDPDDRDGRWLRRNAGNTQIHEWLNPVVDLLARNVIVTLFACSCAGSPTADVQDTAFNYYRGFAQEAQPGHALGDGAFAKEVWRWLFEHGKTEAAVWAHVTYGPATRNGTLRCFSSVFAPENARDLIWMVPGSTPSGTMQERARAASRFAPHWAQRSEDVVQISISPPGPTVEAILTGGAAASDTPVQQTTGH